MHILFIMFLLSTIFSISDAQTRLQNTAPLDMQGDIGMQMVAGIGDYLQKLTSEIAAKRSADWKKLAANPANWKQAVVAKREKLEELLGMVDPLAKPEMHFDSWLSANGRPDTVCAMGVGYTVHSVRWNVTDGLTGCGLLLLPAKRPVGIVIALPDCDWSPEEYCGLSPGVNPNQHLPRILAQNGFVVLVPRLIDRKDNFSGIPGVRMTNQPHREFVYRAAFLMGRTIIAYECSKVLTAIDWLKQNYPGLKIGVSGCGEGGLVALYSSALDTRINSTLVSGYIQPRESLWQEPIYRNVFGLLNEFGDAELLSMIGPRRVVVEAGGYPEIAGPPAPHDGRSGAAPGALSRPNPESLVAEVERGRRLASSNGGDVIFVTDGDGPNSLRAVSAFASAIDDQDPMAPRRMKIFAENLVDPRSTTRADEGQKQQFMEMMEHTQKLMRESPNRRGEFWKSTDGAKLDNWPAATAALREKMSTELIGKLLAPTLPMNPRSRLMYETPKFTAYEVTLDLYPGVFAYGILCLPKGIKAGEKRPVVVCQHGLDGRPNDVADIKIDSHFYHHFACTLAERGFITFSPQNPYLGGDKFRQLQRMAEPIGLTLFSVIIRQHERILDWLETLPNVDSKRIGFYGLSYGGKSAMRIPAIETRYCLSICSADFNEWVWKNASTSSPYSYLITNEYEMPEWNLANTFNYAEMSWLICPRPFMVERGHQDGVAPDEWVAYEYARTRARYDALGIGDRTELEVFNGPHTINGVGTFAFLHKHLNWPEPTGGKK